MSQKMSQKNFANGTKYFLFSPLIYKSALQISVIMFFKLIWIPQAILYPRSPTFSPSFIQCRDTIY